MKNFLLGLALPIIFISYAEKSSAQTWKYKISINNEMSLHFLKFKKSKLYQRSLDKFFFYENSHLEGLAQRMYEMNKSADSLNNLYKKEYLFDYAYSDTIVYDTVMFEEFLEKDPVKIKVLYDLICEPGYTFASLSLLYYMFDTPTVNQYFVLNKELYMFFLREKGNINNYDELLKDFYLELDNCDSEQVIELKEHIREKIISEGFSLD